MPHNSMALTWGLVWVVFSVGEAVTPTMPEVGPWLQGGALTVLAVMMWYQRQDAKDDRRQAQEDREANRLERQTTTAANIAATAELAKTLAQLREHCAVVISKRGNDA